jgi:hypothetical protein
MDFCKKEDELIIMKEIRIQSSEFNDLIPLFLEENVILNRKWVGKEVPPLHRLFPCDVMDMFKIWYDPNAHIIMNETKFIAHFENALTKAKIKWTRIPSKTEYNLSQGKYKYKFSSLRLTKKGFELYLPIMPAHINDMNQQKKL